VIASGVLYQGICWRQGRKSQSIEIIEVEWKEILQGTSGKEKEILANLLSCMVSSSAAYWFA